MLPSPALLLWVFLAGAPADAQSPADSHLVAGAAHFRAGRFAEALVELQVARARGASADVEWYVAAALARAGRPEEALEAFARADREAPAARDALFDYYRALAAHDAHLLVLCAQLLERVAREGGPRLREQAARVRADVARALGAEPPRAAVEVLLARGEDAQRLGRLELAQAYWTEAGALAGRRADGHGARAALERLAALAAPDAGAPP